MTDLSRKRAREALEERREPYWQRLEEGAYLGFRRGPDTWVVRFRGRDRKQLYKALGEHVEYDEAKRQAEAWVAQLRGAPVRSAKRSTVKAALETYLTDLRRHGRAAAAKEAEGRFKLVVYGDRLAELDLEKVTKDDFEEWRDRLRPDRQPRSLNRHVRSVIAGLNRAHDLGHVGNPLAWRVRPLQDDTDDEGETATFLTPAQRTALLKAADPYAAAFLRGLELTGARPNELAVATVGDLEGETLKLSHRKGRPPKLRVRHVVLGLEGVAFFKAQARGKLPSAFLFTEDGQLPWRRHAWARAVRKAITAHNIETKNRKLRIPPRASAYSFRHARISELLQVYGVDPLTVAHQTGTSLVMIEKAYLRFIPQALQDKLKAVK